MMYATGTTPETFALYGSIPEAFGNVSGFHSLTDEGRAQHGFYPVTTITPEISAEQVLDGEVRAFNDNIWTVTLLVRDKIKSEIDAERAHFVLSVDRDTDQIYGIILGNRSTEYTQAEADGVAYASANYSGDVPMSVATWAAATGNTARWAAEDILANAAAWRDAQAAIRLNRLRCKEAARIASTCAELLTVQGEWVAFKAAIMMQLSIA